MVGVVSSIPSGGNFIFADFETPQWYSKGHWLTRRPYLTVIASNGCRKQLMCKGSLTSSGQTFTPDALENNA